jgi:hypothetical protein
VDPEALLALGGVLVLVTFGHLLTEPFTSSTPTSFPERRS